MAAQQTTHKDPGRRVLDAIIYMARLASERQVIEPILDIVREVTSQHNPAMPYSSSEVVRLQTAGDKMREYLLFRDPVRRFTTQELDASIASNVDGGLSLFRRKPFLILILVWALGIAFGSMGMAFLPLESESRFQVSIALVWTGLHLGILWLYLSTLRNFTPSLKHAYLLIVTGTAVSGGGIVLTMFNEAFALHEKSVLLSYGGINTTYTIAMVFFYAGLRLYAERIGLLSFWLHWRNTLLISGAFLVCSFGAGAILGRDHVAIFDLTLWSYCNLVFFAAIAALLVLKITRMVTAAYVRALKWLGFCLAGTALATAQYIPVLFLISDVSQGGFWKFTIPPIFIITELCNLTAAYMFYRQNSSVKRVDKPTPPQQPVNS